MQGRIILNRKWLVLHKLLTVHLTSYVDGVAVTRHAWYKGIAQNAPSLYCAQGRWNRSCWSGFGQTNIWLESGHVLVIMGSTRSSMHEPYLHWTGMVVSIEHVLALPSVNERNRVATELWPDQWPAVVTLHQPIAQGVCTSVLSFCSGTSNRCCNWILWRLSFYGQTQTNSPASRESVIHNCNLIAT